MKRLIAIFCILCGAVCSLAVTFLQGPVSHGEAAAVIALPAPDFWLPFNNAPSNTLPDSSGNGRTGTNIWYSSAIGAPYTVGAASDVSFSVWVNLKTFADGTGTALWGERMLGAFNTFGLHMFKSTFKGTARFRIGGSAVDISSTSALNDGVWHLLSCTRNGTTKKFTLFVDGVSNAVGTSANSSFNVNQGLRLGGDSTTRAGQGPVLHSAALWSTKVNEASWSNYYNNAVFPTNSGNVIYWNWTNDLTGFRSGVPQIVPAFCDIFYGAAQQPVFSNSAVKFDGVNDYAEVWWNWEARYNSFMSISVWVNQQEDPTADASNHLIGFPNNAAVGDRIVYGGSLNTPPTRSPGAIAFVRGGQFTSTTGGVIQAAHTNSWHHVVVVFSTNAADQAIYYDGVSIGLATTNATGNMSTHTKMRLGLRSDGINPLAAFIDDIRFTNYVWTSSDITTLFNAGRSQ